jgi:hypothetical protein
MAWDDSATVILRALVDDLDPATQRYTDARLLQVLAVAAFLVDREVDFDTAYAIDVEAKTITPDPEDDEDFLNLMALKAACIIDNGSAIVAAGRAIAVRDGSSSVDLRGIAEARLGVLKHGWCAAYKEARQDFIRQQSGVSRSGATTAGAVILTPFRLYARGYLRP